MSLRKDNRPNRSLWLPLIAATALISAGTYSAWRLSQRDQTTSKSAKGTQLYDKQSGTNALRTQTRGIALLDGQSAEAQKTDPLFDTLLEAPGLSVSALSKAKSQGAAPSRQSVRADAEFIDDGPREIVMEPATATVTLNGISRQLEPNAIGCFPRMLIATQEHASVLVSYPNATPGDPLVIQCEDGGTLDNGLIVKRAELDAAGRISFQFSAGVPEGIYRILLRKGLDEKHLEFWAGPELALKPTLSRN